MLENVKNMPGWDVVRVVAARDQLFALASSERLDHDIRGVPIRRRAHTEQQ